MAVPTVVSRVTGGASASGGSFAAPAQLHVPGNTLVALISQNTGSNVSSVSNTAADAWVAAMAEQHPSSSGSYFNIYYVEKTKGNAADIVTVNTPGNGTYRAVVVFELNNTHPSPFNTTATGNGGAGSALCVTTTIARKSQLEMFLALAANGPAWVASAGYTATPFAVTGDATTWFCDVCGLATADGAPSVTGGSTNWGICGIAIRAMGPNVIVTAIASRPAPFKPGLAR